MSKKVDSVAAELIRESKEITDAAKEIKASGFSFKSMLRLARGVCAVVETYSKDVGVLSSRAKGDLGATVLNLLVDIPFIPEWLEGRIFKWAIGSSVKFLNEKFGKDWGENHVTEG